MAHHGLAPLILPGGETEPAGIQAAEALDPAAGITAIAAYNGGRTEAHEIVLEPHLVVRGSTAAPPAEKAAEPETH